jgi:hypothetical protein
MTRKYIVSCYSPPSQLEIKSGQTLEVNGWERENKVMADSIANISTGGPKCDCGRPTMKLLVGVVVTLKGKASNIRFSSDGVQFELESEE